MLHSKNLKPGTIFCINMIHIDFFTSVLSVFWILHCIVLELTVMSVKSMDNVLVKNYQYIFHFQQCTVNSTLPQIHYKIHLSNISPQPFLKMPTKSVHIAASIKQIHKNIPSYLYSYFWICSVGLFQ